MERWRIIKRALISFAVLAAAGLGALVWVADRALSAPDLKPRIEKAASEYLARPVTIDSLELSRRHGMLVGRGLKLYDGADKKRVIVDAPLVEAHVALLSVFKLAAGVTELRFVSPRIILRREADGSWNAVNIVHEIASRPDEGGRNWGTLAFNWFTVAGGTVTVQDEVGELDTLPPAAVNASGKLRLGRHRAHFPFALDATSLGGPAVLSINGDLGGHSQMHAELKHGDPALARPIWPPAAEWKQAQWHASLDYDAHESQAWKLDVRASPIVLSTAVPPIDVEFKATMMPPTMTFFAVARGSATEVDVRGASSGAAVDLDVKSRATDMDALLRIVHAEASLSSRAERRQKARTRARKSAKAGGTSSRISATVSVDRLQWGATPLTDVRAVVSRSTGPWVLERASLHGLGGTIEGKGEYNPDSEGTIGLDWTTSGVGLQELFRAAGSSREASGTLDSTGHIETGLGDRFLPDMNGHVQLDLKNGWFGGMPGLIKVMTKLNLATLFAKVGKHHQARVPFDEAHAHVTIANGKMTTDEPLVLRNKTLEIAYTGSLVLPTHEVDGKVVVNILTVTDEIVKLIPGLRDVLLAGEKSMTPIWAKVTGKAEDPNVDVLEGKSISAPFWNTVKHIISLPKKLWDKLTGG